MISLILITFKIINIGVTINKEIVKFINKLTIKLILESNCISGLKINKLDEQRNKILDNFVLN